MSFLFENPLAIAIIGGLTLAIIAGGWLQTQRRELAIAFVAALIVFGGLLLLERTTVTDAEAVGATIRTIAREAEADDVAALSRHFHSNASDYRDMLRAKMLLFQVERVSVKNNLKVKVEPQHQPPQATATFNVVAVISERTGTIKEQPVPRFVTATFWLEDGQWRCVNFKDEDLQVGMQKKALP